MNHLQVLKKFYIVIYKLFLKVVYNIASLFRSHDDKKVVIALHRTKELDGNLKFIYNEIEKQLPDAKIHLVFGENKMNLKLFKEILLLSNTQYLILDDYYLPIYLIKPDSNLKVIQLWHAASAFKKFGYSTVGTKFGPDKFYLKLVRIHSNYTHVYISSEKFIKFYAEAFNMSPDKIFPLGIPRIDLFSQKRKCEAIKELIYIDFPKIQKPNSVNILIAPTYRAKGSHHESNLDVIDSIIKISGLINNNVCIIFKAHPYTEDKDIIRLNNCSNVIVAHKYSINEWMLVSDAFITDYSSSIFEFALLKRPLAHFVPDIKEYMGNRGFYQEIEQVSDGIILQNNMQLVEWINIRESNEVFDSSRMNNYNFDNTEYVSRQIVSHFIS